MYMQMHACETVAHILCVQWKVKLIIFINVCVLTSQVFLIYVFVYPTIVVTNWLHFVQIKTRFAQLTVGYWSLKATVVLATNVCVYGHTCRYKVFM